MRRNSYGVPRTVESTATGHVDLPFAPWRDTTVRPCAHTRVMEGVLAVAHSATLTDHGGPLLVDVLIDGGAVAADCSLTPGELARPFHARRFHSHPLGERSERVEASVSGAYLISFLLLFPPLFSRSESPGESESNCLDHACPTPAQTCMPYPTWTLLLPCIHCEWRSCRIAGRAAGCFP